MASDHNKIENIYSVSEITHEIKDTLEYGLPPIWVQGEVSNFVHHGSGHMYFSLKDENAQITCVMWKSRNAAIPFRPVDGSTVNAYGDIKVYEKRGSYQLDVQKMAPLGIGELQMAFEALKEKLLEEGLFDDVFKKELPLFPQRIGIITSQTGAAIRDIATGLNKRFPGIEKILRPTLVQGEGAAKDIAAAIDELNEYDQIDVIILGRGGGSMEDLWAFNEEIVARAIFKSRIPIVSAVGHQIDYTISDFVADQRAATPSAAAEMTTPDSTELARSVQTNHSRSIAAMQQNIDDRRDQLSNLSKDYAFRRPLDLVNQNRQKIDDLMQSANVLTRQKLQHRRDHFMLQSKRISALHPTSVMQRGYAVVQHKENKNILRQAAQLVNDDSVRIFFEKGTAEGRIIEIDPDGDLSHLR
jgi:exodeoxyribonuclease VII large subunit